MALIKQSAAAAGNNSSSSSSSSYSATLQLFDTATCENPEFIWTNTMKDELRSGLVGILYSNNRHNTTSTIVDTTTNTETNPEINHFSIPIQLKPNFTIKYAQLENEIYIGGVYIRLYLKQPTYKLKNSILFLEKLIEIWETSYTIQVAPNNNSTTGNNSTSSSSSTALILGKEDFLSLLTSCIIHTIQSEPILIQHLINWGYIINLPILLNTTLNRQQRGVPMLCILRILYIIINNIEILNLFANCNKFDIIVQITNCLQENENNNILSKYTLLIIKLLKKLYHTQYCIHMNKFVQSALQCNLPIIILNKIIDATTIDLNHIQNNSMLRIHSVELIKAILLAGDETVILPLQNLLNIHPAWKEFKHQNHDLFLTVS